jgi:hypothetical protein
MSYHAAVFATVAVISGIIFSSSAKAQATNPTPPAGSTKPAPATKPAAAIEPGKLQPCPLTASDFHVALGVSMQKGKASELNPKSGRMHDCSYLAALGTMVATVTQTWLEPAQVETTMKAIDRYSNSRPEPIAGDPDKARWLIDPVHKDIVALQYLRANVRTEVRVTGGELKPDALRSRLLKLKRVP